MRNFLFLSLLLFMCAICFAQVTEKWVTRQNGDPVSNDVPNDLAVDAKGNVYVTGRSIGKGTNTDFTTVKYNSDGDQKWERRYNGPGNSFDEAIAITVDSKCNVYVTGWSTGSGTGRDFATIKYDEDGDREWVKRYNGPGNEIDEATAIAVDRKGNVYVTGWSTGNGSARDFTTIKYDNDGNTEWIRRFNGPGNEDDQATDIAVDDKGNVYVTGFSTGVGTGSDYTTIKYDDDGDQEWVQRFNGPVNDFDIANALALDASGNVYVTGRISVIVDEDGNPADIATIKYSTSGVQEWAVTYHATSFDVGVAIAVDDAGNVVITGRGGSPDETFFRQIVTIQYNTAGIQQWAQTVRPAFGDDEAEVNDLVLDAAGNVYITGFIRIGSAMNNITIKYNSNGIEQWRALNNDPEPVPTFVSIAGGIGLDENGNVYITSMGNGNGLDFITIKYNAEGLEKWTQIYDGPGGGGPDIANAIAVNGDGHVHVTGGITKIISGIDYTTYKYDNNGDRIWKKTYTGPGPIGLNTDLANDIVLDAEGNVYITGKSAASNGFDDYATIKYNANGITQWVRRFNGPGNSFDEARAIAVDENGNVYVTGGSVGIGTNFDYSTIKYDGNGNIIWERRYNNPNNRNDLASDIAVDNLGNVYVTGASDSTGANSDYITIKYDANGNELWVARYNGPGNSIDGANALAVDAAGNAYVTGFSAGSGTFDDYATIKYNTAGAQLWVARYNGPGNAADLANDLALDALGNVYVTGQSEGSGTFADYATIKYNTAGVEIWIARFNGPGNAFDAANALAVDAAGNVYVTGQSEGTGSLADYSTIKYNAAGVQQWEARYNGPGNGFDIANAIDLDDNGNVYVTGRSEGNGSGFDYATIKYEQTPVMARSSTLPEQNTPVAAEQESIKLSAKAFPNAFTEFVNLQWHGSNKPVTITITDALGRLVEKRTGLASNGVIQTGYKLRPGVYFAEIVQGTEKLVLKLIRY
jgi:uncharacterized delta-60 repeat protein